MRNVGLNLRGGSKRDTEEPGKLSNTEIWAVRVIGLKMEWDLFVKIMLKKVFLK